ncbi:MAG TPA: DNA methyltransferase [Flavobacteriales bacterium]|nr:DNA methyltransferase [Flavobacteriales bacterium]HMR28915.1 DNA methyltransferase [Flavobacteriales bacterium]
MSTSTKEARVDAVEVVRQPRILNRAKLDVTIKTRSNLFNWRGQFTPEFVEYLLSEAGVGSGLVVDPFCGSGTVLQECALRSREAHGFEINPAAYAMSRFFTLSEHPAEKRRDLLMRLDAIIGYAEERFSHQPLFEKVEDYRERAANLLNSGREMFEMAQDRDERLLVLLTLFEAESLRVPLLGQALRMASSKVARNLTGLAFASAPIRATLGDARSIDRHYAGNVDLIITSPPYINVFNYHQNHRALMEMVGFNILHVAASEIGSNRKNRGNRLRTVVQYALDMEACLHSMAKALKSNGRMMLIVGRESNVRGLPVLNSKLVASIAEGLGCFHAEGSFERCFTNRFGASIYEDVLIFRRTPKEVQPGEARSIAKDALAELRHRAIGDVLTDLDDAIQGSGQILESPIFEPTLSV